MNRSISKNLWKIWRANRYMPMVIFLLIDFITVVFVYGVALWLRFDCRWARIEPKYINIYRQSIPWVALLVPVVYSRWQLYRRVWSVASFRELELCFLSVVSVVILHWLLLPLFFGRMPLFYYAGGGILQFFALCMTRFGYRFYRVMRPAHSSNFKRNRKHAMIIGGGAAASMIIREVNTSPKSDCIICCAIDDDRGKWGCVVEGVQIIGGRDLIFKAVEDFNIEKIFLAIPNLSAKNRRDILTICKDTGTQVLALPNICQLANEEISVSKMREVSVVDLLGRPPILVNTDEILGSLRDKVILVTGGGGSIGSELCRQIAGHSPRQLIIFDVYENNAYEIEQELRRKYGTALNLVVLIGSVRDTNRLNQVFSTYKPEIVFHAAAHKHVPLMEKSPCEAIKNNVLGTYKTACAAIASGVKRFVLISTDKAVNPTNIMGASKRLCEMIVQSLNRLGAAGKLDDIPLLRSHESPGNDCRKCGVVSPLPEGHYTEFVVVRFGNVLGTNGSVIPLFKKQIADGGPVTVTHPDIVRYFMTIPEAVSLVLQAAANAKGGEIFVLDMGEPVKIVDLARNMIKLSGMTPDVDIKIQFTGLRPGEKLYEERLMSEEGLQETENKLISIAQPIGLDVHNFLVQLEKIASAAYNNAGEMKLLIAEIVDTFHFEKDANA